jgi:Na+-driven multidrug efflux pump
LGSLTLGIMVISIQSSFTGASMTLISQAFGAKDLKLCRLYLNRQIFLSTCVYVILAIPQLFIR